MYIHHSSSVVLRWRGHVFFCARGYILGSHSPGKPEIVGESSLALKCLKTWKSQGI